MSIFLDIINLIYKKKINKIRKKQSAIFFFRIVSTSLSSSSIYGEERNEIAIYLNTENEMAEREGKFDTRQAALNLSIIPRYWIALTVKTRDDSSGGPRFGQHLSKSNLQTYVGYLYNLNVADVFSELIRFKIGSGRFCYDDRSRKIDKKLGIN